MYTNTTASENSLTHPNPNQVRLVLPEQLIAESNSESEYFASEKFDYDSYLNSAPDFSGDVIAKGLFSSDEMYGEEAGDEAELEEDEVVDLVADLSEETLAEIDIICDEEDLTDEYPEQIFLNPSSLCSHKFEESAEELCDLLTSVSPSLINSAVVNSNKKKGKQLLEAIYTSHRLLWNLEEGKYWFRREEYSISVSPKDITVHYHGGKPLAEGSVVALFFDLLEHAHAVVNTPRVLGFCKWTKDTDTDTDGDDRYVDQRPAIDLLENIVERYEDRDYLRENSIAYEIPTSIIRCRSTAEELQDQASINFDFDIPKAFAPPAPPPVPVETPTTEVLTPEEGTMAEKPKDKTQECLPLNLLKSVEGRILTIMEAAIPSDTQREAIKTLIKKEFRREMNKINSTDDEG